MEEGGWEELVGGTKRVQIVGEWEELVGGAMEMEPRDRVELVAMAILPRLLEVAMHCRQVDLINWIAIGLSYYNIPFLVFIECIERKRKQIGCF